MLAILPISDSSLIVDDGAYKDSSHRICFATPLYDMTLHHVLRIMQPDLNLRAHIVISTLSALEYLHRWRIAHCDVKPDNIFINKKNCRVVLGDFGLAHRIDRDESTESSANYIVTRWYRSIELLCGRPFDCRLDVWSLACVWAEAILMRPLFVGTSEKKQILAICTLYGVQPHTHTRYYRTVYMECCSAAKNAKNRLECLLGANGTMEEIDLISRMLHPDPSQRVSCAVCMESGIFGQHACPSADDSRPDIANLLDISDDLTLKQLHATLDEEIRIGPTPASMPASAECSCGEYSCGEGSIR